MIRNLIFQILLVAALFCSCSIDSDSYYFEEESTKYIQVEAFITRSFDESAPQAKVDTIVAGDTIIFLSSIQPAKTVRSQKIYWTLDGELFAKDYSFSSTVKVPGLHEVAFFFVDYFGDISSDTVHLYVASPPVLDNEHFIPANNTQNIAPSIPLNFAWNSLDPDSLWDIQYHFVLKESIEDINGLPIIIIDTVIKTPYFTNLGTLSSLTEYYWEVSAINSLQQISSKTISGNFFTSGNPESNSIQTTITTSSGLILDAVHFVIMDDSTGTVLLDIPNAQLSPETNSICIKPIPSGKIKIAFFVDSMPDYAADTILLNLQGSRVFDIPPIYLQDNIDPTIASIDGTDTLDIADTIKILVQDGGGNLIPSRINVALDGNPIAGFYLSGDTLKIPLDIGESWTFRNLTIAAKDLSGNRAYSVFYIRPNTEFSEVFQ